MRRCAFVGLVAAGIAVGHTGTYAFVASDGHTHFATHAHRYEFGAAAVVAVLGLLLWSSVQEVRRRACPVLARGLVAAQVVGFLLLETAERLVVSGDVSGLVDDPALWAGLVAQLTVAWLLRDGFHRIPRLVAAAWARRPRSVWVPTCGDRAAGGTLWHPAAEWALWGATARAPPSNLHR